MFKSVPFKVQNRHFEFVKYDNDATRIYDLRTSLIVAENIENVPSVMHLYIDIVNWMRDPGHKMIVYLPVANEISNVQR